MTVELYVGDIIEFPEHPKSTMGPFLTHGILSHGAPGKWRVTAIKDGNISLEPLQSGAPCRS